MSDLKRFLDILGPDDVVRALQKAREIIPPTHDRVMWHGSGSGDLRGGASGLHLGTHEAARQALEARIGVPAEGNWYGTRAYGETMLMGKDRIPQRTDGYPYVTGHNVHAPAQDYLPTKMPHVSRDVSMDPSWAPSLAPYRITGEMKNTPQNPLSDMRANSTMQGLLKRGQARRGLYYRNEGEDFGSVSATVPGPQHVEPIDLEQLLRTGKYAGGGGVKKGFIDLAESIVGSLPMDEAARLARAKDMGFDTSKVWYHSALGPIDKFEPYGKFMGRSGVSGIHFTDNPEMANRYLERFGNIDYKGEPFQKNVIPVYLKPGSVLERDEPFKTNIPMGMPIPEGYQSPVAKMGYDALLRNEAINSRGGVKHVDPSHRSAIVGQEMILHDPSRVRSIFAEFNPDFADSHEISRASGGEVDGYAAGGAKKGIVDLARGIIPGSFSGHRLPSVDALAQNADKFVYHSGVADDLPNMERYLEPRHGDWVREVAAGDVDDPEQFLDESAVPLLWMSKDPSWVRSKVARKLGVINHVTVRPEDIHQHGHVALIPRKGDDAENIWWVGSEGLNNGPYSSVTNLRGDTRKAYETDLFDHPRGPFGVERNEFVSAQPVEPMLHLTGDALVDFLRKTGHMKSSGGDVDGYAAGGAKKGIVDLARRIIEPVAERQERGRRLGFGGGVVKGYAGGGRPKASLVERALRAVGNAISRPTVFFEVAPGKTWDPALQEAWETMSPEAKRRITRQATHEYFKPWQRATGVEGDLAEGVGGFGGFTNPNNVFYPKSTEHLTPAMSDLGETFAQDAMMGVSPKPFSGSAPRGVVTVNLPKGIEEGRVHDIYQQLLDRDLTEGHSTNVGRGLMSMLVKEGRDTGDTARGIDSVLGRAYPVMSHDMHVGFPEKGVNYGLSRPLRILGSEQPVPSTETSGFRVAPEDFKASARDRVRSLVEKEIGSQSLIPERLERGDGGRNLFAQAAVNLAKKLGNLHPEGSGYVSVPGKPSIVTLPGYGRVEARPIPEVEASAVAHQRRRGFSEEPVSEFIPLNPAFSSKVAQAFENMKDDPRDPAVRRAYDAMIDDTMAQYRAAKDTGIDFRFLKPGEADPYAASPALGYEDIVNKGRLFMFPTDQGFGSSGGLPAANPLLRRAGRVGDKDDAVINDAFRVVHDLYGHFGPGNPFFRAPGEERAFQLHSKMFSPEALPAATAETRGQNSWVNYGPYGAHNRAASGADTVYADQKVGRLPDWAGAMPPAADKDVEEYVRSLIGRASGGRTSMLEDEYPSHYLPGVGRQVMRDGGAPAINQLTAQLLRYGWTAPKLDYLKQVPRQGFEDGGVAAAMQAIQNTVGAPRARPQFSASDFTGTSNYQAQNPGAYTDAGGQKVAAPYVSSMRGGYPVFNFPQPAQPTQQASPFLGWLRGLFGGGRAAGGGVQEGQDRDLMRYAGEHDLLSANPVAAQTWDVSPEIAQQRRDAAQSSHFVGEPGVEQPMNPALPAMALRILANLHPAGRIGSRVLDAADAINTANRIKETGKADAGDLFSLFPGGLGDATSFVAYAADTPQPTAKDVFSRMREQRADGGRSAIVKGAVEVARQLNPFGHYSPAAEAVAGIKQEKGRVGDFLNALKGRGVTAAELEHSGVASAFAPDAPVTRSELADYFHSKLPNIEEKIYGGAPLAHKPREIDLEDVHGDDIPDWKTAHYELGPKGQTYTIEEAGSGRGPAEYYLRGKRGDDLGDYRSLDEAVQAANDAIAGRSPAKYAEYQLPGAQGYREVVMYLPPSGAGADQVFKSNHLDEPNALAHLRFSDRFPGLSKEQADDILQRVAEGNQLSNVRHLASGSPMRAIAQGKITPEEAAAISRYKGWRNGYADKPGIDNSQKALHLEELQSDWGQTGRDEGFLDSAAIQAAEKRLNEIDEMSRAKAKELRDRGERDVFRHPEYKAITDLHEAAAQDLWAAKKGADKKPIPGPYVTDTNQWTDLGLKRALKEAAEGGYDKMIWSPGDVHADRYNLAKHLKEVVYNPETGYFRATSHSGADVGPNKVESEKELAKLIGKDTAKRLLEQEKNNVGVHALRGDDLSLGGHGMREFYDKMVPSRLSKLVKKLDPEAKIELFSHELPESKTKGHVLHLTPALREAIKQGLPAFKDGGTVRKALSAIVRYRDPKSTFIKDWKWRPLSDVQADVGTNIVPEHVQNFGRYMANISDKAATEGLDPEDLIKSYMITRSSIQREGRTPSNLAAQGALIRETDEPLVRPEGQMAEWLQTAPGVRFLNEARRGDLSQDVVDSAMRVMKPFGMAKVEPDAMDWARRNLPEQAPLVSDLVARAREGASPASEWRDFTKDVRGIGPAKTGFIASLLGRGDLPTLDARQAILHTGMKNADVQDIMSKRSGRVGHEAVDRLAARQRAMGFELPEELDPFYQHLAHHTVWDAIGNEKTTHQDIIDAMQPRGGGGRTVAKALVEKERIPRDEAYSRIHSLFGGDDEGVQKAREIVRGWQVPDSPKSGGYYIINQSRPVSEITREISDIPGLTLKTPRPMSWEDFYDQAKGGSIINIGGDRSDFGRLTGINGRRLPWPVDLHAGPKYALEPSPGSVWANAPGPATGFKNTVLRASEGGRPVYGVLSPMGPRAVTSSHNMAETLLSQIYGNIADRELTKKMAREFDKRLKGGEFAVAKDQDKYVQAMKDWPGLENAKEASDFLKGQSGTMRRDFADYMDAKTWRDAGFPMVGETRAAITDPELLFMPSNAMGHRVVRFDPENITPKSTTFEHSTYPVPTGGEYIGDLPALPRQYVMPTAMEKIMQTLAANKDVIHPMSSGNLGRISARKLFEEQKLLQPIDEDFLSSIRLGEERKKAYGFRKGGSVVDDALAVVSRARRAA